MGIIVCITFLLGVLAFLRSAKNTAKSPIKNGWFNNLLASAPVLLLVMGLWNAAWYGLRHLGSFWGHAALVSGIVMLLVGLLLFVERKPQYSGPMLTVYHSIRLLRWPLFIALLASFLLYAVTLIQLNLGYSIIH